MGLKQTLIRNLRGFRKKSGLSQLALSLRCNTAASYIGEIEIGRKTPSLEMLEKIAGALDVPTYMLLWEHKKTLAKIKAPQTIPDVVKEDFIIQLTELLARFIRRY